MPEGIVEQSAKGTVVVRHQKGSCFILGKWMFGVVVLGMQG